VGPSGVCFFAYSALPKASGKALTATTALFSARNQ